MVTKWLSYTSISKILTLIYMSLAVLASKTSPVRINKYFIKKRLFQIFQKKYINLAINDCGNHNH